VPLCVLNASRNECWLGVIAWLVMLCFICTAVAARVCECACLASQCLLDHWQVPCWIIGRQCHLGSQAYSVTWITGIHCHLDHWHTVSLWIIGIQCHLGSLADSVILDHWHVHFGSHLGTCLGARQSLRYVACIAECLVWHGLYALTVAHVTQARPLLL
jgi:hypothetical protein